MVGLSDDRILALGSDNCDLYKSTSDSLRESTEFANKVATFADFFKSLETLTSIPAMNFYKALPVCEYLIAADLHNKELKFDVDTKTLDSCHEVIDLSLYY